MTVQDLPAINATLNALSAVWLVGGYVAIRRGARLAHQRFMLGAFATSTVFLACYLTYHFSVQTLTRFVEPAGFRPVYLAILLTHTVLATVLVPLVFRTLYLAWRGRFEVHRRWARWTWPIWLYVSVTGVVIYLLLYQVFPQSL